jgi:hypothetical protein
VFALASRAAGLPGTGAVNPRVSVQLAGSEHA